LEEFPENSKESSHSTHANVMNERKRNILSSAAPTLANSTEGSYFLCHASFGGLKMNLSWTGSVDDGSWKSKVVYLQSTYQPSWKT